MQAFITGASIRDTTLSKIAKSFGWEFIVNGVRGDYKKCSIAINHFVRFQLRNMKDGVIVELTGVNHQRIKQWRQGVNLPLYDLCKFWVINLEMIPA